MDADVLGEQVLGGHGVVAVGTRDLAAHHVELEVGQQVVALHVRVRTPVTPAANNKQFS